MKKRFIATVIFAACTLSPAAWSNTPQFPHLITIGTGEITATPDMARIDLAVNLTRSTAQEAKNTSDEAIVALLSRLEKMGIERKDVKSADLNLQPQYSYKQNSPPKLTGYRANRNVIITIKEIKKLNAVLDGAMDAGLNQVNSISFSSSKEREYKEEARMAAIGNARSKAASLAKGFDVRVAGVWQISYTEQKPIRPLLMQMAARSNNVDTTYLENEIIFTDQVEVIFALGK